MAAAHVEHRGIVKSMLKLSDTPKEKVRQRLIDPLGDILTSISEGKLEKMKAQVRCRLY